MEKLADAKDRNNRAQWQVCMRPLLAGCSVLVIHHAGWVDLVGCFSFSCKNKTPT